MFLYSPHLFLPLLCPQICSLCLCLYFHSANRLISNIFLDSIYMHYCIIFVVIFLTYFILYNRLYVHPPHYSWLKWRSNIPLYLYNYNFFIRSSVYWHLGCFHVLAIVNSAAIGGAHVSFSVMVFSGYMPSSGIVGSYGSFIPVFFMNLHTVPHSCYCCSVLKSCLTLWSHGLQHARPPCPSPSPEVCPSSCPSLRWWCHPAISSSNARFCPQSCPALRTGTPVSPALGLQWVGCSHWMTKILELQIQHQSFQWLFREYNIIREILISLKIDWFAVQGTFRNFQHHSLKASILWRSAFFMVQLSQPYMTDHWDDHSLDYTDLCWQSNVSAFQHTF